jgi:hypothetical protein
MEFRREAIGEQAYETGVASLGASPESERIGRWILAFLKA